MGESIVDLGPRPGVRVAARVLLVDPAGRLLLFQGFDPHVPDESFWFTAGGGLEPGEELLAGAQRELREETGLRGGRWTELASFWSSPGFTNERVTVFAADGLDEGEPEPDEGEEIELVRWSLREVESRLSELEDATTLVGLLLYLRAEDPPGRSDIVAPP